MLMADLPVSPLDDDLSPLEREFFKSRGVATDELYKEQGITPGEIAPEQTPPSSPTDPVARQPDEHPPAAADDDDEPATEEQAKNRRVNYNKWKRTEEARKVAEAALNEERIKTAKVNERLAMINEALAAGKTGPEETAEEEDPEPDKSENIFAHNEWLSRQLAKANERFSGLENTWRQQQEEQQLRSAYYNDVVSYAQEHGPAITQAYRFLVNSRDRELDSMGYKDDAERQRIIVAEERQLVSDALANRARPAERILELAKLRGFAPASAQANGAASSDGLGTATAQPAPGTPLGKPASHPAPGASATGSGTAGAAPATTPSAVEEIAAIKRGTEAARSLSNAGGSAPMPMTAEMLAGMSEEEFEVYYTQLQRGGKNKLKEYFGS